MIFSREFDFAAGATPWVDDPDYWERVRRETMEMGEAFRQAIWGNSDRDKALAYLRALGYDGLDSEDGPKRAIRRELFKHHPDRGGERRAFERAMAAKDALGV